MVSLKHLLPYCILFFGLLACTESTKKEDLPDTPGVIRLELTNAEKPLKLSLIKLDSDNPVTLDTALLENGKASIGHNYVSNFPLVLVLTDKQGNVANQEFSSLYLFPGQGEIVIKGNAAQFSESEVTGDKLHRVFSELVKKQDAGMKELVALDADLQAADPDSQEFTDAVQRQAEINTALTEYIKKTAVENAGNPVGAFVACSYLMEKNNLEALSEISAVASQKVPDYFWTKKLSEYTTSTKETEARVAIGAEAVNFRAIDLMSRDTVALNDYRGKPLLLYFWKSDEAVCRDYNKELVRLKTEMPDKFNILGVFLDYSHTEESVTTAIKEDKIVWANIPDEAGQRLTGPVYGVDVVPYGFLLDEQGKIIAKHIKIEELEAELKKL